MKNRLAILTCFWIIGSRSVLAFLYALCKPKWPKFRYFINRLAHKGALKIFKTIKARYRVTAAEPLNPDDNYIFMSNHQSLFDLPLIFATMPGTIRFIAKKELFTIPIFGKALSLSECIPIDRFNPIYNQASFNQAKEKIQSGISVWLFPEGTRSKDGKLLPLKSGGVRLAQETGCKIIPVAIRNTKNIAPARTWNLAFDQEVSIHIGKPIDVAEIQGPESQKILTDQVTHAINQMLQ